MIIFAGIVSAIPDMIKGIYEDYFVNIPSERLTSSFIFVGILNCGSPAYHLLYNLCTAG